MKHLFTALVLATIAQQVRAADVYDFMYSTTPYIPLVSPIVVTSDDGFNGDWVQVPVGFDFHYWGEPYNAMHFNTHGYCWFGDGSDYGFYPFNVGLVGLGDSRIGYELDASGGEGHRILKVEWKHTGFYSDPDGSDHVSWQVWLHEGIDIVELRFGPSSIEPEHFAGTFGSANGPEMIFAEPHLTGHYTLEGLAESPSAVYAPGETIFLHGFPLEGMVYAFTPSANIGIEEPTAPGALTLYPQPAVDQLNVVGLDGKTPFGYYAIVSGQGALLSEGRITSEGINVGQLAAGTYLLRIMAQGSTRNERFIRSGR